jgi:hypothetical protein
MPVVIHYRDPAGGYSIGEDAEFAMERAVMNDETGRMGFVLFFKG